MKDQKQYKITLEHDFDALRGIETLVEYLFESANFGTKKWLYCTSNFCHSVSHADAGIGVSPLSLCRLKVLDTLRALPDLELDMEYENKAETYRMDSRFVHLDPLMCQC